MSYTIFLEVFVLVFLNMKTVRLKWIRRGKMRQGERSKSL